MLVMGDDVSMGRGSYLESEFQSLQRHSWMRSIHGTAAEECGSKTLFETIALASGPTPAGTLWKCSLQLHCLRDGLVV
jgi:hypothetical protein